MVSSIKFEGKKPRNKWDVEMDQKLIEKVRLNGPTRWKNYDNLLDSKTGKSC